MVYPAHKHVTRTLQTLREILPVSDRSRPQIIILSGEITGYRHDTDRELPFRQESNFHYLTGCDVPSSILIAAHDAGTSSGNDPTSDLFIPKAELADLMWSVPPPSIEEARKTHDVTNVLHTTSFVATLEALLRAMPGALVHTLPEDPPSFPQIPEEYTRALSAAHKEFNFATSDTYLIAALQSTRLIKDEEEVKLMRQANQISSKAHEVVMRILGKAVKGKIEKGLGAGVDRPLLPGEWLIEKEAEAEAIFVASCRREGAVHQAYLPIVAASTRASTLHYCCNDRDFAWGPVKPHDHHNKDEFSYSGDKELLPQVLLIDAGCEWNCYASDITRTMPVGNGGKFTPEARAIYELVLEMQKESFNIIRAGLHWDHVQMICHRTLVRGFQRLGIFKTPDSPGSGSWNSEDAILASGVSAAFFPHGVGHSLGLDVHDVPTISRPPNNPTIPKIPVSHESFFTYLRLRLPLRAGMVATVEPGIYFSPHLLAPVRGSRHIDHEVLKKYESVGGVRIEDAVVVTDTACENLTTVRSDPDWVEGVCSGEI
ncbi:Creatinase/aminopeptidase [Amanita muscaria]